MKQVVCAASAVALAVWLGAAGADRVLAQAPAPPSAGEPATFEAASVKPNRSGENRIMFQALPGRFTVVGAPLAELVRFAYQLQPTRIFGLPDWSRSDRFDIVGKLEVSSPGA